MNRQQCMAQAAALVVIGVCVLVSPVLAQDCPERVGRWPYGRPVAVAASQPYAYIGSGTALVVADVSNAAAPLVVGEVVPPGPVMGVTISGSYADVADDGEGLRVLDVSDPANDVEVGSVDSPGGVQAVAVSGARDSTPVTRNERVVSSDADPHRVCGVRSL